LVTLGQTALQATHRLIDLYRIEWLQEIIHRIQTKCIGCAIRVTGSEYDEGRKGQQAEMTGECKAIGAGQADVQKGDIRRVFGA
jgi:hypothetical protein